MHVRRHSGAATYVQTRPCPARPVKILNEINVGRTRYQRLPHCVVLAVVWSKVWIRWVGGEREKKTTLFLANRVEQGRLHAQRRAFTHFPHFGSVPGGSPYSISAKCFVIYRNATTHTNEARTKCSGSSNANRTSFGVRSRKVTSASISAGVMVCLTVKVLLGCMLQAVTDHGCGSGRKLEEAVG